MALVTHPLPENIEDARNIVNNWRWDDGELPIPNTPFGYQLAAAVDILIGATGTPL
jgi:hypothetical protein